MSCAALARASRRDESCTSRRDVGPFARKRQEQVRAALAEIDVELIDHPGTVRGRLAGPDPDRRGQSLHRVHAVLANWSEQPRREVIGAPRSVPAPSDRVPPGAAAGAGRRSACRPRPRIPRPAARAGRTRRAQRFIAGPIGDYADGRNTLTGENVSRLSPYLHFGCLSPREIEARLPRGAGAAAFRRQLCWRDFYAHVLGHFPANAQIRVPGALPRDDPLEPRRKALRGLVRGPHRATRASTPACASCAARAGCTTAPA